MSQENTIATEAIALTTAVTGQVNVKVEGGEGALRPAQASNTESSRDEQLPEYDKLPRSIVLLTVFSLLVWPLSAFALLYLPGHAFLSDWSQHSPAAVISFVGNLYIFLVFWTVYFTSVRKGVSYRQTLRSLLTIHSQQWGDDGDETQTQNFRKKAESTMVTQAIFIAITVFILNGLITHTPSAAQALKGFDAFVLTSALFSASLAFTILLIATDAAESMFNSFKVREWHSVSRLYKASARLKYYGFVLTFLSISLYVFNTYPAAASAVILAFLVLGYRYWFPDITDERRFARELWVFIIPVALYNLAAIIIHHVI